MPTIDLLLRQLKEKRGSDLHLSPGMVPYMRVDGAMLKTDQPVLNGRQIEGLIDEIMPEQSRDVWSAADDHDFAYELDQVGRFRVNALREDGGVGAVIRSISDKLPREKDLGLPHEVIELVKRQNGLILITGPTGSGKTTTLAVLIDLVNRSRHAHIITIEDPIEFKHESKACLVRSRELGRDVTSFPAAIRAAMREDPDVIVVGEIRDRETLEGCLSAAETGHLVFGTLHTSTAVKAVHRIVDLGSSERQAQIRTQFADTLLCVIAQKLIPKATGGRHPAFEIMINTQAVTSNLKNTEKNALGNLGSAMNEVDSGMRTMERALAQLAISSLVDPDVAREHANDPKAFDLEFATLNETPGQSDGRRPAIRSLTPVQR